MYFADASEPGGCHQGVPAPSTHRQIQTHRERPIPTHTHTHTHADTRRMVLCYKGQLPFCSEALWGRQATRKRGIGLTLSQPLAGWLGLALERLSNLGPSFQVRLPLHSGTSPSRGSPNLLLWTRLNFLPGGIPSGRGEHRARIWAHSGSSNFFSSSDQQDSLHWVHRGNSLPTGEATGCRWEFFL